MASYTAYFDASGNHRSTHALFVSGLVGKDRSWERFRSEWMALLEEHGLDNPFHMTEFMAAHPSGRYAGWRGRQGLFLIPAIRTIRAAINKDVSQGIVVPDFDRLFEVYDIPKDHHLGGLIHRPLAYCGVSAILQIGEWAARASRRGLKNGPLRYVFDRGDTHRGDMAQALKSLFGIDVEFADKSVDLPLQAADILAWSHGRVMADHRAGKDTAPDPYVEISRHFPGAREWVYGEWPKLAAYCEEQGFAKRVVAW